MPATSPWFRGVAPDVEPAERDWLTPADPSTPWSYLRTHRERIHTWYPRNQLFQDAFDLNSVTREAPSQRWRALADSGCRVPATPRRSVRDRVADQRTCRLLSA